jgi:hypothetical protein
MRRNEDSEPLLPDGRRGEFGRWAVSAAPDKKVPPVGAQSGQDDVERHRTEATLAGTPERSDEIDQLRRDSARSISLRHA